jgi:hypothetical protein
MIMCDDVVQGRSCMLVSKTRYQIRDRVVAGRIRDETATRPCLRKERGRGGYIHETN